MAGDEAVALMQQRIDELYAQVDAQQQRMAALNQECQEAAEALLRTHRILARMTTERDAATKENAALREISEAVAEHPGVVQYENVRTLCAFCQSPEETPGGDIIHASDCPVTKARILLGE